MPYSGRTRRGWLLLSSGIRWLAMGGFEMPCWTMCSLCRKRKGVEVRHRCLVVSSKSAEDARIRGL